MKKLNTEASILARIFWTYADIAADGIAWLIAALISIYGYGPYGLWKSYCDYEWVNDLYNVETKLKKELDRQHNNDMNFYMCITVLNLLAWVGTILLIAKYA